MATQKKTTVKDLKVFTLVTYNSVLKRGKPVRISSKIRVLGLKNDVKKFDKMLSLGHGIMFLKA